MADHVQAYVVCPHATASNSNPCRLPASHRKLLLRNLLKPQGVVASPTRRG